MPRKTLSVLVPTFNAAKYVVETTESILKQSRMPDEIIFSDDASSDNTVEILEDYASRYRGLIRILRNDKNLGFAGNRQRLLEAAKCEMVKFFDDDDIMHPCLLELLAALLECGQYDLAACSVLNFANNDINQVISDFPVRLREWNEPVWAHHIAVAGHVINKMHDKEILMKVGGFRHVRVPSEDFHLDILLMKSGARLGIIAEYLVYHRARKVPRTIDLDKLMAYSFLDLKETVEELVANGSFEGHPKQRKILADRLWHMGRLLSDSGQFDLAIEAFAASRKLLNQGIVHGGFFYKIVATFLGIGAAEKMRCQLSKIKNKAR
jgi:glycosyltransferase involved in cell wall biosynthesis